LRKKIGLGRGQQKKKSESRPGKFGVKGGKEKTCYHHFGSRLTFSWPSASPKVSVGTKKKRGRCFRNSNDWGRVSQTKRRRAKGGKE